ncbi:MAG: HPr family phosphocarrier protein [Anaerolineaceae bacterium]|nr:HPr family phosphocarrier protein [Anaerolineaceae bacterium]
MVTVEFRVNSIQGLHARPADLFIHTVNQFSSEIRIKNLTTGSDFVNAKSILRVLSLGVYHGHIIQIQAEGTDEMQAIEGISALVKTNFL